MSRKELPEELGLIFLQFSPLPFRVEDITESCEGGFFDTRKHKIMGLMPEMLEPYREYLMDEERSRATVEKYLRDARKFLKYLEDDGGMDKEKVRGLKVELTEHHRINSVNSMPTAVGSFLEFAGREDLKVRLLKARRTVYSRPEREITEKEYGGLVWATGRLGDSRMNMLLRTIGNTGIRVSELKFITVESLETGWTEVYSRGESWVTLLPVELTRLLKKYYRKAGIRIGSTFITRQGDLLDRSNVNKKMK